MAGGGDLEGHTVGFVDGHHAAGVRRGRRCGHGLEKGFGRLALHQHVEVHAEDTHIVMLTTAWIGWLTEGQQGWRNGLELTLRPLHGRRRPVKRHLV